MSKKDISRHHQATFDGIRHQDEDGNEYWRARQLKVLEYRQFLPVVARAKAPVSTVVSAWKTISRMPSKWSR
ncbi:hypothetical protein STPYR_12264 [uncultured Stenotrophomonas sp.]|uniref:Uncharacterized protein n=1 Tax=uncultured Stenotrophomonas sp. TaxID=165438 RepID=A0A1Y5QB15_9GAMM|nr:hypothetical protein STPYR_12264 [uncultured Stenotrophomonas sp.]